MDQTVGPEGPPNVTWRSSAPLEKVKMFFETSASREAPSGSHSRETGAFIDQTQFLAEQASILQGRNDPGSNHSSVVYSEQSEQFRSAFAGENSDNYRSNLSLIPRSYPTKVTTCPRTIVPPASTEARPHRHEFDQTFGSFPQHLGYNSYFY